MLAEKLLAHRVDQGPLRDVAHEDGYLGDVRRGGSGRVEDAPQVAEDLPCLLNDVALADDLASLVRCHEPGHVKGVAGDYRMGKMADRLHEARHPERPHNAED